MDYVFLILASVFLIGGLIGSLLPVIPGPPLSWIGLLFIYFCSFITWDVNWLIITAIIAVVITILDFIIPAQGTKKMGGTKYGIWGTNIGLLVGIFTPIPMGIVVGPFVGAFIGELLQDHKDKSRAIKAAFGAFLGFLMSTFLKLVFCIYIFVYAITLVSKGLFV
ncbi:MAG: DUF456 domain-containing protein [Crocinitomicaceae bacterium]|nr:DUF456 domain-containing protein [Crocinitomicaceae bacterium]